MHNLGNDQVNTRTFAYPFTACRAGITCFGFDRRARSSRFEWIASRAARGSMLHARRGSGVVLHANYFTSTKFVLLFFVLKY